MKLIHTCIALSLAGALSSVSISAQQPAPPAAAHERAKSPEPVSGELISVDTNAKTFAVKTAPDSDMKFSFSEETQIIGGDKGLEGLATIAGTPVIVTYDVHGTANIALKVEVLPKKQ